MDLVSFLGMVYRLHKVPCVPWDVDLQFWVPRRPVVKALNTSKGGSNKNVNIC